MSDTDMATEHNIQVNGIQLHYATWGTPASADRAVVLIHGITANWTCWEVLGPTLARAGWYVIAPDLRGRGQSEKPPHGYGIPYHANDILSLCDALGFERVSLVGHSLGALISILLAAVHPGRIRSTVCVDAGGKVPDDALETVATSVRRIGMIYPSADAYMQARRESATGAWTWTPYWERYYRYDMEVRPDGTATARMPKHALDEEVAVNFFERTEAMTSFIKAPTLIVRATLGTRGPDRGFVLPAEEAVKLRDTIVNARLAEIPNTTHYDVILADDFLREVTSFLGGR